MVIKTIVLVAITLILILHIAGYRFSCCKNGWMSMDGPVKIIKLSESELGQISECNKVELNKERLSFRSTSELDKYLESNELCFEAQIKYLKSKE